MVISIAKKIGALHHSILHGDPQGNPRRNLRHGILSISAPKWSFEQSAVGQFRLMLMTNCGQELTWKSDLDLFA